MALAFSDLRTEFWARGFDYLNDSAGGLVRTKRFLNDAMHAIDDMENWPYLNATASGTAPLAVTDLARVESVVDTANPGRPLRQRSRGELTSWDGTAASGSPFEFYVTGGTTINAYPAGSSITLGVNYWRFAPDMTADTDVPLMPDRFRYAIVEYAVATALRDDESADAAAAQLAGDMIVQRMQVWAGLLQPPTTVITGYGDDY